MAAAIAGAVLTDVIALPRNAVRQLDSIVLVDRQELTLQPWTVEAVWSDANYVVVPGGAIPGGMMLSTTPLSYVPTGTKVEIIPEAVAQASIADAAVDDDTESATQ